MMQIFYLNIQTPLNFPNSETLRGHFDFPRSRKQYILKYLVRIYTTSVSSHGSDFTFESVNSLTKKLVIANTLKDSLV